VIQPLTTFSRQPGKNELDCLMRQETLNLLGRIKSNKPGLTAALGVRYQLDYNLKNKSCVFIKSAFL
jgi:hypothetical protein